MLVPPPLLFLAVFILALQLNRLVPLALYHGSVPPILLAASLVLILAGVPLGPASIVRFLRAKTTLVPQGAARTLITDGAYRVSRNPMYVGIVLLYLGVALWMGAVWPLIALIIPCAIMNSVFIPFEEQRLRALFGDEFEQYCRRVRRWI